MTLRLRLLLSALILSLATTFALALVVRSAWKTAEEERFEQEFQATVEALGDELGTTAKLLNSQLRDLCENDPIVDSALVGVTRDDFKAGQDDGGRLLSLRARLPGLRASLGLDELQLISGSGQVLAGNASQLSPGELSATAKRLVNQPGFRTDGTPAFEASCIKKEHGSWVALLGAKYLDPILRHQGVTRGLDLKRAGASQPSRLDSELLQREMEFAFLKDTKLIASRSRHPLQSALRSLNIQVATAAGGTLLGALLLALLLSRGLARPIVLFAEKTRQVVRGNVPSIPVSGGPELEQAARAFNETLEDLRDLRERLVLTERIAARREVARQIAHEIKNPLSPIRTSIESLRKLKERDHPQFDELFEETTSTVLHEVRRISNLVSNFSEYARLPTPVPGPVDIDALSEEIVSLHQDLGAEILLKKGALPEISADRDQLSQVLTNLIKNALEATRDRESPKIYVGTRVLPGSDGDWIEVAVSDNGAGVPESQRDRLFEPYVTTKSEGTGLGLPISQRIAIEHGGDLTYTTSQAGGACFVLLLPTYGPPTLSDEA